MSDEPAFSYRKSFDPPLVEGSRRNDEPAKYDYTERAVLTINAAMATRRPVLVRGPSGSGKSSMTRDVARVLGWDREQVVIDSRTTAQDLRWRVDLVSRLAEAQLGELRTKASLDVDQFIHPGVIWWAFEPESAGEQHTKTTGAQRDPARLRAESVVLLDEIDKADPDLPNGLLEVLEEGTFSVDGRPHPVERPDGPSPLVFVTTNSERRLPDAFLRRCLELELGYPDRERMRSIAAVHDLDRRFDEVWEALFPSTEEMTISPAEFLDTITAFEQLDDGSGGLIERLAEVTAWKRALDRSASAGEDDDW